MPRDWAAFTAVYSGECARFAMDAPGSKSAAEAPFFAGLPPAAVDKMGVRQAREYVRLERAATALRPGEALPRRLQACMQELLSVNERYHELLQTTEGQREELEAAREELSRLRPAVATLQAKCEAQTTAVERAESAAEDHRAAYDLQTTRCTAAEAERDDLHRVVQAYAERLIKSESENGSLQQRSVESDAWLATHWQAGYEQGVAQQKKEVRGRTRRSEERTQMDIHEAFERGQQASAAALAVRTSRVEAERRLLVRRAEASASQQRRLSQALENEREAKESAARREETVVARLASVRHEKSNLASELKASRDAHSADLDHFDQMHAALGLACAEYSSLAAKHARSISPPVCPPDPSNPLRGGRGGARPASSASMIDEADTASPPRRAGPAGGPTDEPRGFGCSPVDAMRTRLPVPARASVGESGGEESLTSGSGGAEGEAQVAWDES